MVHDLARAIQHAAQREEDVNHPVGANDVDRHAGVAKSLAVRDRFVT